MIGSALHEDNKLGTACRFIDEIYNQFFATAKATNAQIFHQVSSIFEDTIWLCVFGGTIEKLSGTERRDEQQS